MDIVSYIIHGGKQGSKDMERIETAKTGSDITYVPSRKGGVSFGGSSHRLCEHL
jgi:hypothetical protein